jgi:subtilisin family serine protease
MKLGILLILMVISFLSVGQEESIYGGISYNKYKAKSPNIKTDFAVKGDQVRLMNSKSIHYKYSNNNWHFIRCTSLEMTRLCEDNIVHQIYFTPSFPTALNDTMRLVQNIDSVHFGHSPLNDSFTGKGVIIGYVDTGIDFTHGDFINNDGSSRVLRYWDHSLGFDAGRTPTKYGYGQVWTNEDIDNGICTSTDNHAHGTTVTGAGSGNANENGMFKGAAPESDIIIVETNFNLANWTLTVADAIDYIFMMADSLDKPAVVNTSVGDYLGSHDGTDPAGHIVDSLLNSEPGRIVVAALGNSGNWGKYHVNGVVNADTSFTWFEVNPSSALGTPAVYFDFWADTLDFKNVDFAFGANVQNPNFDFRGRTQFLNIQSMLNQTTFDSIMNGTNLLSPIEIYAEEVNGVYHLEVFLENPDSSNYLFSFMTHGSGEYDLWSGTTMGLSNIVSTGLPSIGIYPDIIHYHMPDTLKTLVSSWNCLESVVSVGNFAGQQDYIDVNGNLYTFAHTPGKLSMNSSKGPNRKGYMKPDVSATGDGLLSAVISAYANNGSASLAQGGMHIRNGGTSMACPVIAGIAALYLEKCPKSTYVEYRDDLHAKANQDNYTGATPNYGYGYGKVDAFELLNTTNFDVTLIGDTLICNDPGVFQTLENNFITYNWFNGDETPSIIMNSTDTVYVTVENERGCKSFSDSIIVIKGTLPLSPIINILGGGLVTTPANAFQWYFEDVPIIGATEQFYNPDTSGTFYVEVYSPEGCSYVSESMTIDLSTLIELKNNEFVIFPNPFVNSFQIIKNDYYDVELIITDVSGKIIYEFIEFDSTDLFISVDLFEVPAGLYFITLNYNSSYKSFKLIKQ